MARASHPLGEEAPELPGSPKDGLCFTLVPTSLPSRLNTFGIDCKGYKGDTPWSVRVPNLGPGDSLTVVHVDSHVPYP